MLDEYGSSQDGLDYMLEMSVCKSYLQSFFLKSSVSEFKFRVIRSSGHIAPLSYSTVRCYAESFLALQTAFCRGMKKKSRKEKLDAYAAVVCDSLPTIYTSYDTIRIPFPKVAMIIAFSTFESPSECHNNE